jgi:Big-like domain-containing protein
LGSDAWAVGDYQNSSVDLTHRTLILHLNGTAWAKA